MQSLWHLNAIKFHHYFCGILKDIQDRTTGSEGGPRYLKEAGGQYMDIKRKQQKNPTSYLQTIKINNSESKEEASVNCR